MPLELRIATRTDANRIAEIHMAAFGSNAMLQAQFPTPTTREALKTSIEKKAQADIDDSKTTVLVVVESQGRDDKFEVIAFAKWSHPVYEGENYAEPPWIWPEGTDYTVLDAWTKKTEEAHEKCLGSIPSYHLSFIGTDPLHEKKGAGALMIRWGIERCKAEGIPLYLESTLEAVPFYENHGFIAEDFLSMQLPGAGSNQTEVYEEVIFTYRP